MCQLINKTRTHHQSEIVFSAGKTTFARVLVHYVVPIRAQTFGFSVCVQCTVDKLKRCHIFSRAVNIVVEMCGGTVCSVSMPPVFTGILANKQPQNQRYASMRLM